MGDEREEIARLLADFNDYVRGEKINRVHIIRAAAVMSSRIKAILARAQGPGPGEAVAWRVKDFADGWTLCATKTEADALSLASSGALVEPLYAATPTREACSHD